MIFPDPSFFSDWQQWARQLQSELESDQAVNPQNVLLAHKTASADERITEGLMRYDPMCAYPLVGLSSDELILGDSSAELEYSSPTSSNGHTLTSGGFRRIDFDTVNRDSHWITLDAIAHDFTLEKGLYYFDGYFTVATFDTLAAVSLVFSLEDSTSTGGNPLLTSAPLALNDITDVRDNYFVPLRGFYEHTTTIDLAFFATVGTTTATLRLGHAHGLTGYENVMCKMQITPVETRQ